MNEVQIAQSSIFFYLFVEGIKVVYIWVKGGECKWANRLNPELSL